jgi:hypothetical protein
MNKLPFEQIIPKLTELGLVKDGNPVSFAAFKKIADAHPYGRRHYIYVIYVGTKENRFGFYPPRTNKVESVKIAYGYYLDLFSEMKQEWLDGNVKWGNCGISLMYSGLRCIL